METELDIALTTAPQKRNSTPSIYRKPLIDREPCNASPEKPLGPVRRILGRQATDRSSYAETFPRTRETATSYGLLSAAKPPTFSRASSPRVWRFARSYRPQ